MEETKPERDMAAPKKHGAEREIYLDKMPPIVGPKAKLAPTMAPKMEYT